MHLGRWRSAAQVLVSLALLLALLLSNQALAADAAFKMFLQSLWPEAQKFGVSRATFELATRDLEPDLSLPDLVIPGRPERPPPGQPEFVLTPTGYLKEAMLARLAAEGRKLRDTHRAALGRIEQEFGVPGPVVLAIWARETDYGRYKLPHNALRVLATQAYYGKRKDHFRQELLYALKMLEDRYVSLGDMKSSWAGAMGLTQFLPSEFYKYAVDFDGDGRADIFRSVPDALASAAKQLAGKGWQRGMPWAVEVRAPQSVDCTLGVPDVTKPVGEWVKLGFALVKARLSREELAVSASLLQPEGIYGPSFLATRNYFVIKDYNFSDLYVLFVGNLADRIAGGRAFETPWAHDTQLRTAAVEAMQRHLTRLGFYRDKVDGKAGMLTRAALGAYQKANNLALDCWPSAAVLDHMRSAPSR